MSNIKVICTVMITMCCFSAKAQLLSDKEIGPIIDRTAQLIKENYVYAEKGGKIAAHLVSKYKEGAFRSVSGTKTFDSLATTILQQFSQDGHLYVHHDKETAASLLSAPKPEEGEDLFFYGPKAVNSNYGFQEVKIMDGNIGYIRLSLINISDKSLPVLYASMQFVSRTKALIIDLRDNGGGGSNTGAVLESFFLPKNTALLEFKSKSGGVEKDKTVSWLTEEKYSNPVYILINKRTASAAEAFAYIMQAHKRAVIVGQASAGAANMNTFYPVNASVYVSISTAAPSLPGKETSWEQKGVQPDHVTTAGEEIKFINTQLRP